MTHRTRTVHPRRNGVRPALALGPSAHVGISRDSRRVRLLRRTQTVRRTVEGVPRDDIACGSTLCSKCAHLESDPASPTSVRGRRALRRPGRARARREHRAAAAVPARATSCCSRPSCARRTRAARRSPRAPRVHADPRHARGSSCFRTSTSRDQRGGRPIRPAVAGLRRRPSRRPFAEPRERRRRRRARRRAPRGELVRRERRAYRWWWSPTTKPSRARRRRPPDAPGVVLSPPARLRGVPPARSRSPSASVARRRDAEEAERAWRSADEVSARAL